MTSHNFFIISIFIFFTGQHAFHFGLISNISLVSSTSSSSSMTFIMNQTSCERCFCQMLLIESMNFSRFFNCLTNETNGIICQFFANLTFYSMIHQSNSSFYFLDLPPPLPIVEPFDALQWNRTGVLVAGNGTNGSTAEQFNDPRCIYVDENQTIYVCDTENDRIQKWIKGSTSGVTVAGGTQGKNSNQLNNPRGLTFDSRGFMYVVDTKNCRIQRFSPSSSTGMTVAGNSSGRCGNSSTHLQKPTSVLVDDNFNLYVADNENQRVLKYEANSSRITSLFGNLPGQPFSIAFCNGSTQKLYLSDDGLDQLQLWTVGASSADVILANTSHFREPKVILADPYGHVYVADRPNAEILMFKAPSSIHRILIGPSVNSTPILSDVTAMAFDSDLNLYVTSNSPSGVFKYKRL